MLKLPVLDGVHAALEAFNEQRKAELDRKKMDRCKRRQIVKGRENAGFAAP